MRKKKLVLILLVLSILFLLIGCVAWGNTNANLDKLNSLQFTDCAEGDNLKRIRVHDIRHSHASLLINKGQNILIVSQRLGHSDVTQTLNTYSHLMPNVQKQIINALDFEM